jgi:hypothetical protein
MVNNITDEMARFIWVAIGIQARRRLKSSAQPLTVAIKKKCQRLVREVIQAGRVTYSSNSNHLKRSQQ